MDRALFVPHEDVADVVLLEDLVIDRQHRAARIAEHGIHTLILQGLHDHPRAAHHLGHLSLHPSAAQGRAARNKKPPKVTRGRMGT